MGVLIIGNTTN